MDVTARYVECGGKMMVMSWIRCVLGQRHGMIKYDFQDYSISTALSDIE